MKENKVLKFELSPQNLRIKNVLRNDFVAIDVYAISDVYPNRNNSHFTANSLRDAVPTFYNKPALGAFNVQKNDFKAHEMELKWDNELQQDYFDFTNGRCEVPLGVIRSEDTVEIVELDGQTWVHFTCVLWAKYCYRQVKRLLKDNRKKISVEVEVLESHVDENGVEVIDKFTFDGFSLLGEDVVEAIPNAHLTILDKVNDAFYQKQERCLSFAYKGLDTNSIHNSDENEINKDSFADDSGEIVENEKIDEITMEHREEESQVMTYEEKMKLLNAALGENRWVNDADDAYVYYHIETENGCEDMKAPYTISEDEEGHLNASVDEANAVRVMRSWKEYAEENPSDEEKDDSDTDNKETEAAEENKEECSEETKETEACENKEEESAENKEECSEEEKECKFEEETDCENCSAEDNENKECESENEDTPECEDKDCESVAEGCEQCANENPDEDAGEEKEVESAEGAPEEDKDDEGDKEEMSADVTIDGSEKGEEEVPCENIDTDIMKDHDDGSLQTEAVTYAVGEESLTADQLYERFNAMSVEYNSLKEKFDALNAQFSAKQNDEFYSFACSLIDAEEDLTAENNSAIKAVFSENCKNSVYDSTEAVQTAVEHSLADALYAQKKMSKAKKTETFSVSINKSQNNSIDDETSDNTQNLKNLIQKLRRI